MVKAKKIFCVVAYDIQDDRSRIQISKILEKYGTRINYSVFECMFTDSISSRSFRPSTLSTIVFLNVCLQTDNFRRSKLI